MSIWRPSVTASADSDSIYSLSQDDRKDVSRSSDLKFCDSWTDKPYNLSHLKKRFEVDIYIIFSSSREHHVSQSGRTILSWQVNWNALWKETKYCTMPQQVPTTQQSDPFADMILLQGIRFIVRTTDTTKAEGSTNDANVLDDIASQTTLIPGRPSSIVTEEGLSQFHQLTTHGHHEKLLQLDQAESSGDELHATADTVSVTSRESSCDEEEEDYAAVHEICDVIERVRPAVRSVTQYDDVEDVPKAGESAECFDAPEGSKRQRAPRQTGADKNDGNSKRRKTGNSQDSPNDNASKGEDDPCEEARRLITKHTLEYRTQMPCPTSPSSARPHCPKAPARFCDCHGCDATISEVRRHLRDNHGIVFCDKCWSIVPRRELPPTHLDVPQPSSSSVDAAEVESAVADVTAGVRLETAKAAEQRHKRRGCESRCIHPKCKEFEGRVLLEKAHKLCDTCCPESRSHKLSNEWIWRYIAACVHGTSDIIEVPYFWEGREQLHEEKNEQRPNPTYSDRNTAISRLVDALSLLLQVIDDVRRDNDLKSRQLLHAEHQNIATCNAIWNVDAVIRRMLLGLVLEVGSVSDRMRLNIQTVEAALDSATHDAAAASFSTNLITDLTDA